MIALETYLQPLQAFLDDSAVSEIIIQPTQVWVERQGQFTQHKMDELTINHITGLMQLIARFNASTISEHEPLLACTLPPHFRVQMVMPPATSSPMLCLRKPSLQQLELTPDLFKATQIIETSYRTPRCNAQLNHLFLTHDFVGFIREAVRQKKTIVISGATSTGKTTFLNACLTFIDKNEHLVTLEDVPEIQMNHPLHTPLFTSHTPPITMHDLVKTSLRLRPDRIIVGELRGGEALDFMHAINTGHEGSFTSIHAHSVESAFLRLMHLVKLSVTLTRDEILQEWYQSIDIVIQLVRRIENGHLVRQVSEIYYADVIQ